MSVASWAYDERTTFLRQSITTHFEAPFVWVLSGTDRSVLIDTGTGDADLRGPVDRVAHAQLIVAHTHTHSDHVGGDNQFTSRPNTTIIAHEVDAVRSALGIPSIEEPGQLDLGGGRILDVLAIPGHEAAHVAFYDRSTQILFTGDTLYPGRLYVRDWGAYRDSITRLLAFAEARPVRHVIGAHIEMDADRIEYPEKTVEHPNEHGMLMALADLRELKATLDDLGEVPARRAHGRFVIVPLE